MHLDVTTQLSPMAIVLTALTRSASTFVFVARQWEVDPTSKWAFRQAHEAAVGGDTDLLNCSVVAQTDGAGFMIHGKIYIDLPPLYIEMHVGIGWVHGPRYEGGGDGCVCVIHLLGLLQPGVVVPLSTPRPPLLTLHLPPNQALTVQFGGRDPATP
jgi:hypothetical protein